MNIARLALYVLSMIVAVLLIFIGGVRLYTGDVNGGLLEIGVGLALVLLNSSRPDRS